MYLFIKNLQRSFYSFASYINSFLLSSRFLIIDALSVLKIVIVFSFFPIPISIKINSISVSLVIFEFSFKSVSVCPKINSYSIFLVIIELAFISISRKFSLLTIYDAKPMLFAIFPFSFVRSIFSKFYFYLCVQLLFFFSQKAFHFSKFYLNMAILLWKSIFSKD